MYLFVYKTVHKNGKYYIGRHQTKNLNDGYLGSGKWVNDVKDKSNLSREIITKTDSFEELCKLEEYYIQLHWSDPLCMNMIKGSDGFTSDDAKQITDKRISNKTHNFLGPEGNKKRINEGRHNLVGGVTCYNKIGNIVQIPKQIYYSQIGPKENWEWVHNRSSEGIKRSKTKTSSPNGVPVVNKNGHKKV